MKNVGKMLRTHWREIILWSSIAALAAALPLISLASTGHIQPSQELIVQSITAACPVAQEKQCMETADLLSSMASLYETVIVLLIGLLALVAALVYVSIRSSSRRQIEDQFRKDFESDWLQSRLQDKIRAETQSSLADTSLRIARLELAVKQISSRDDSESHVTETEIVTEGEGKDGAR